MIDNIVPATIVLTSEYIDTTITWTSSHTEVIDAATGAWYTNCKRR